MKINVPLISIGTENLATLTIIQGHPERMLKVNLFARALIFTKSGFSGMFRDEK